MKTTASALLLLLATASAASQAAPPTLCSPQETVVFSCPVGTGKKTASVCASKDVSATQGSMQYRFGSVGSAPELSMPKTALHPKSFATAGSLMFSGGGGDYLRMKNGAYAYVAYSGMGKGWAKDGIAVEKNGAVVADLVCSTSASGPFGSVLFSKLSIPAAHPEFEIP